MWIKSNTFFIYFFFKNPKNEQEKSVKYEVLNSERTSNAIN